jgi:CTP:phosphocholine cytidylyltransferase-like protein
VTPRSFRGNSPDISNCTTLEDADNFIVKSIFRNQLKQSFLICSRNKINENLVVFSDYIFVVKSICSSEKRPTAGATH